MSFRMKARFNTTPVVTQKKTERRTVGRVSSVDQNIQEKRTRSTSNVGSTLPLVHDHPNTGLGSASVKPQLDDFTFQVPSIRLMKGESISVDSVNFIPLFNFIYHGVPTLKELNIAVNGTCDFELIDLQSETVISELSVESDSIDITTMNDFTALPQTKSILQLRGRSDDVATIESVEVIMV